ncbi:hypothetical protein AYK26_02805 [Euryarchaeota archaeon SM23-78]|nr:MAG: hypothetical protein AYK26_02805 [Euryarchaeota archaeon SM23-78]MBW3000300.1 radical SAM protein [Candidatus Woesearchaeota archaeon]
MEEFNNILSRSKIYAHPERLTQWMKTGKTLPITAEIDPTNKCNYNCKYCAGNKIPSQAELTYNQMKTIIDKISPFIKGILFTGGGEPLINPETTKAISYAHKKNIDVGLVTNGSLLHTVNQKQLLSDCEWIRIGIDAANQETYAKRKNIPKENYQKVWNNISELVKTRNKHNLECTIGVAYLTENEEKRELEAFTRLARDYKVDYVQFRPYHHVNNNLIKVIKELKQLKTDKFKVLYSREKYKREKFDYKQAFGDEFRFVISATGDVYPDCFTRGLAGFSYGNLLKQSFEGIWSSEKRKRILESKLQQENCPPQCKHDELNQLLWLINRSKEEAEHKNFV